MKFYYVIKDKLKNSYAITSLWWNVKLIMKYYVKNEVVLVYQMGKVGSTSVIKTIKAVSKRYGAYHLHFLNKENIVQAERKLAQLVGRKKYNANSWCLAESKFIRAKLERMIRKKNKLKIVTLVRDPIGRNLSSFFENIERYSKALNIDIAKSSPQEIFDIFQNKFHEHNYVLNWFDEEIKSVFTIDVYNYKFDKERGYTIIKKNIANVLIIRLDKLDQYGEEALKKFLGEMNVKLAYGNVASNKNYDKMYKRFLKNVQLSEEYVEKMYSSKLATHFFTKKELEHLKNKWLAPV